MKLSPEQLKILRDSLSAEASAEIATKGAMYEGALAMTDVNHHARAVDIGYL